MLRSMFLIVFFSLVLVIISPTHIHAAPWVSGYYPGWTQSRMKPTDIDYSAVTHIMHFAAIPKSDGSLDTSQNMIDPYIASTISATHAAGKKILITLGGANSQNGFRVATTQANRTKLISSIVNFMKSNNYDGIDVDWEPLADTDSAQFTAFITELRAAMTQQQPGSLLTAAAMVETPQLYIPVKDMFDQINIMTYVMSGPWEGWVTWHSAPLKNGGRTFSNGRPLPSVETAVKAYLDAGISKTKLGIGTHFGGSIWSGGGVTGPRQSFTSGTTVNADTPYYTIMDTYHQAQNYHYDTEADAAYLSINSAQDANDKFISYDNAESIAKKISYLKTAQLGGIIIWELNQGYFPNAAVGQRDPLLKALKEAIGNTEPTAGPTGPTCSNLQGDTNHDGAVRIDDFAVWRSIYLAQ